MKQALLSLSCVDEVMAYDFIKYSFMAIQTRRLWKAIIMISAETVDVDECDGVKALQEVLFFAGIII